MTAKPATKAAKPSAEPKALSVLTTKPGRYGARGFASGIIIEGIPAGWVNQAWQDADPTAVRDARRAGAAVVRF